MARTPLTARIPIVSKIIAMNQRDVENLRDLQARLHKATSVSSLSADMRRAFLTLASANNTPPGLTERAASLAQFLMGLPIILKSIVAVVHEARSQLERDGGQTIDGLTIATPRDMKTPF